MTRWTVPFLFISTFTLIYAGVHLYVFRCIRRYTHFRGAVYRGLAFFFLVMIVSPVLSRMLEKSGFSWASGCFIWASSLWIGFMFYWFLTNLVVDAINLAGGAAARVFRGRKSALMTPGYRVFAATVAIPLAICVYAYFEALHIGVTNIDIYTTKLPKGTDELVVAQLSDVHLGVIVGEKRLARIIAVLRRVNPDIIVSTGDLLDREVDSISHLAVQFDTLRPRLGKYAILGNHEFYAGVDKSADFIRASGFRLLRGECLTLPGLMNIVGVDDPAYQYLGGQERKKVAGVFARRDADLFTLFLIHRPPEFLDYLSSLPIDLQLSGHTHGGQLFPFRQGVGIFFPLRAGLYSLGSKKLYVSRGAGTWGPPLRFLTPPEIVVIRLIRVPEAR